MYICRYLFWSNNQACVQSQPTQRKTQSGISLTIISISIPKRNSRTLVEIRGLRGPPNEVFHCPLAKSIGCVYPPMVKRNASRTNWMTIVNILPNLVVASLSSHCLLQLLPHTGRCHSGLDELRKNSHKAENVKRSSIYTFKYVCFS